MAEPVQLYICYAKEDSDALSVLEKQLGNLTRVGRIEPWHRGKLIGGDTRDQDIAAHLDRAKIIIVLVSSSLSGEYYDSAEMQRAFRLHKEQKIRLIPVIVRPCLWQNDPILGNLEPLPRGGNPAGLDETAWFNVVTEINKNAMQVQSEQAKQEPAAPAQSSRSRARSRRSVGSRPQPLAGAAIATTTRRTRATPPPAPSQPASPSPSPEHTLPAVEEPEPDSAEARATTPAFSQDYNQAQNGPMEIVFAILVWEPSQFSHTIIADERHAVYHALLKEKHQCTLGSSLPIPQGQSLQDCEITQAQASDLTVLLVEPQIPPMNEWQAFYYTYDPEFLNKTFCFYPKTEKLAPESWTLDETLYYQKKLQYYQESEITDCSVRAQVLQWVHSLRLGAYRDLCRRRKSGR